MNPTEQGTPAWAPPTGPDFGIQQAAQANACPLFQSPLFWLIAIGLVVWVCTSNSKESEIDDE